MPKKPKSFIYGANESMQENLDRGEPVIFAAYGVIGAILLLGGAGYLLDRWLGTQPWFLLGGFSRRFVRGVLFARQSGSHPVTVPHVRDREGELELWCPQSGP